jgi:hypothetical protein
MPYTPNESITTLKHFYRRYFNQLWGTYGFKDAFNLSQNWFANSYLAIDQGPIIVMIENYRSGLLWNLFMSNPEIQSALDSIGFVPDSTQSTVEFENLNSKNPFSLKNYPNPFNNQTEIEIGIYEPSNVRISIYDLLGREVKLISNDYLNSGHYKFYWKPDADLSSSIYFLVVSSGNKRMVNKIVYLK